MAGVGVCHICGRLARNSCNLCGRMACDIHYDAKMGICFACKRGRVAKK